jgi:ribosomal protein S6--L-glutamate ligase
LIIVNCLLIMPLPLKTLSFHLLIETQKNRLASKTPGKEDLFAIQAADAVILPQGCNIALYNMAKDNCRNVFPNYDAFYNFPGKTGQAILFQQTGVVHPETCVYQNLASFNFKKNCHLPFPQVFKFSWGGEGSNVFLVKNKQELVLCLEKAREFEKNKKTGFIIQEYIPTGGLSLRVVVIGNYYLSYWRVGQEPDCFYSNLAKGASLDFHSYPERQKAAVKVLKNFCQKTKINLAGFDFIFSSGQNEPLPMFLEINYFFRTKGLGGADNYLKILENEIKNWLNNIKI